LTHPALACGVVLIAFGIRQELEAHLHLVLPPYITFYPAVMLVAIRLGLRQGLLATALAAFLTDFFILRPTHSFLIQSPSDLVAFAIFCAICVAICLVAERSHRTTQRLAVLEKDAELRESRDLLRLFIEHSLASVAMFDREMRYLAVSQEWVKEYGLLQIEVLGCSHYEIFPEIEERWKEIHRRSLAGETIRCEEDHFTRQDGKEQWLRWEVRPWTDRNGQVGGIVIFSDDITERYRAAESLRDLQNKLSLALQYTPDAIFIADKEGAFLEFNEAFASFHKFRSKNECPTQLQDYPGFLEVCGKDGQLVPLEQWAVPRALRGETGIAVEYQLRRRDTGESWVGSFNYSPVRDRKGEIIGAIVTARDVTEQRNANKELAKSEARFRRLFEDNGSIFLLIEPMSGRILDANHAAAAFYGYSREQLRSMLITQINTLGEAALKVHRERTLGGQTNSFHWIHRLASGEERQVETFSSPVENNGRKVLFSVVRDVTEVRRTEQKLRLSEERYRSAFRTSLDAILITRIVDGKILDANPAFLEMTGYRLEDILSRTTLDLGLWDCREDRHKLVSLLQRHAICRDLQALFRRQGGERFWGVMSASPLEIEGEACAMEVLRDISEAKRAADALQASEKRYRTTFQTSIDAIVITEFLSGRIVESNLGFQQVMGYTAQELRNRTTVELNLWVEPRERDRMLERLKKDGNFRNFEFRFRRQDGAVRWGWMSAALIQIDGLECNLSFLRDVTEIRAAADGLRASEERYRTAFQTSIDAIAITRIRDGQYIDVNRRFEDIFGWSREELLGRTSAELGIWIDAQDRETLVETIYERWHCQDMQTRFRRRNGDCCWAIISVSRIDLGGEACMMSIIRDVSAARMAEEQIRNLAYFDPLTGLANRNLLLERLRPRGGGDDAHSFNRALLFIDLDGFRGLNDARGQQAGDQVLREVGMRLTSCLRAAGAVARMGGDEFVVLLEELNENPEEAATQAGMMAETILERVEWPFQLEDREWNLSCCIGIAVFNDRISDYNLILQQADIATTLAKRAGRGSIRFFAPELQASVDARTTLEEELRRGLRNDEMRLFYQPQVERGKVIGAEVLVRWQHPTRGLLSPGEFIPLAEETRLIVPLGEWVLEAACRQIAEWNGKPSTKNLQLAVNVSAVEVHKPDFVPRVLSILERTGANPGQLELEITETILMEDIEETIAKMNALKAHGLRFSIDDFGTGYSSLSYLKRFPLDQLKIDISFVRDILVDQSSSAIAHTIISLGEAMGLAVIAEGVENEPQRDHLAYLGCHAYQGYLFSRPVPAMDFEEYVGKTNLELKPY
jgi:diguanylate cyclase (GGDEF)-like protein/PAS domain S-box-containing protein